MLLDNHFRKEELAQQLRTSTRTLDRWESLGIGPPRVTIGKTILYKKDSVLAWLESRESKRGRRGH